MKLYQAALVVLMVLALVIGGLPTSTEAGQYYNPAYNFCWSWGSVLSVSQYTFRGRPALVFTLKDWDYEGNPMYTYVTSQVVSRLQLHLNQVSVANGRPDLLVEVRTRGLCSSSVSNPDEVDTYTLDGDGLG